MNSTFTPKEFITSFKKHHPDATYSEVLTLLCVIVDATLNNNADKGMTSEQRAEDADKQVKQFIYDLPLSDENYNTLIGIARKMLLEETYANS